MCGVLTYLLEVPLEEEPDYIQFMFSVPYNLQVKYLQGDNEGLRNSL